MEQDNGYLAVKGRMLVARIKAHGLSHYDDPGAGWHIMIETMEDSDILRILGDLNQIHSWEKGVEIMAAHLAPIGSHYDEQMAVAKAMARGEW